MWDNGKTDEEYRKVLRRRNRHMLSFSVIGLIMLAAALFAAHFLTGDEYVIGLYSGVGTGLFAVGVVLFLRNLTGFMKKECSHGRLLGEMC